MAEPKAVRCADIVAAKKTVIGNSVVKCAPGQKRDRLGSGVADGRALAMEVVLHWF